MVGQLYTPDDVRATALLHLLMGINLGALLSPLV
jgi:dipeptide/tripeptide permease